MPGLESLNFCFKNSLLFANHKKNFQNYYGRNFVSDKTIIFVHSDYSKKVEGDCFQLERAEGRILQSRIFIHRSFYSVLTNVNLVFIWNYEVQFTFNILEYLKINLLIL